MDAVVGRAMLTGVLAGAIAVPAGMIHAAFRGNPIPLPTFDSPELLVSAVLSGLLLLVILAFVGALAGMLFGVVAGVLLGALRAHLTGRPGQSRVAGVAAFGGAVGAYALTLALLGTSPVWWVLLCASELVVAVIAGAWRGPAIVDGRPARIPAAAQS